MKIQSTTSKSVSSTKKKGTKDTSGAFQSLFSAQVASEPKLQAPDEQAEQKQPQQQNTTPQAKPALEDALNLLEKTMLKLDEGEHIPEQAILAIEDLRQALKSADNPLNMSIQEREEADTLLAVESKRLEKLNKM
ncbi:MAG: hypothetical protein R8M45_02740 [Ghiorsea sp.]